MTTLSGKTVLVTGANRGIGAALVQRLLKTGATKIYAAARNPAALPDFGDARVVPVALDLTDTATIADAVKAAPDVDVLLNNAGIATFAHLSDSTAEEIARDMDTNYYGTLNVVRGFLPQFQARHAGTIVNVISVVGLTPAPILGGYSASKAALQSATQTLRASLKGSGISVLGVYPGPIDTDMARDLPFDKASPESTADLIVKGIEAGETYIFPDPTSQHIGQIWATDGRALDAALSGEAEALEAAE